MSAAAVSCHVRLWRHPPAPPPEALLGILARSELDRAHRFGVAAAKTTFLWRRLYLRVVAARRLGTDPQSLSLGWRCHRCGESDHGRPVLAHRGDVSLSTASSGGLVAVAVAVGATVGVDIESVRPGLSAADLDAVLSPDERSRLSVNAGSPGEAARQALVAFVRKEALLKLAGTGLSGDPRRLDVAGGPLARGWRVISGGGCWTDVDLRPLDGHVGAVALSRIPVALSVVLEPVGGDDGPRL
ncbi:MAG: 4'-phosphopantetheinyl transferase family protein [Acidimicrobiia bacterium]